MHNGSKANGKAESYAVEITAYDSDEETQVTRIANRYAEVKEAVVSSDGYKKASVVGEKVYDGGSWMWGHFKNASWIVGTTVLVAVIPLVFEFDREVSAEQQRRTAMRLGGERAPQTT